MFLKNKNKNRSEQRQSEYTIHTYIKEILSFVTFAKFIIKHHLDVCVTTFEQRRAEANRLREDAMCWLTLYEFDHEMNRTLLRQVALTMLRVFT